ncbi:MAG: glycosyltransferase [Symbiobacteriia bacterium]
MHPESELLSLCMIVRDEADFLPRCLSSVQGVVDEIILVDTGSTDGTPELARGHGARVFSYPWAGDFEAARNYSLGLASGAWLLVMDADEALHPDDTSRLRELLKQPLAEGFILKVLNFIGPERSEQYVTDPVCRLFRNRPEYRYQGRIHEDIEGAIRSRAAPKHLVSAGVRILHYGYLDPVRRERQKSRRNQAILRQVLEEKTDDPSVLYCLGTEELQAARPQLALDHFLKAWRLRRSDGGFASDLIQKIALCHWELGQAPLALEALETGTALYRDFTDLHYLRGRILSASGQPLPAIEAYRQAIAIGEAPAQYTSLHGAGTFLAHHGLGRAYEEACLHRQAAREYYRALWANPRFTAALPDLLRLVKELGGMEAVQRLIETRFRFDSPDQALTLCENLTAVGLADLADACIAGVDAATASDPSRYWFARGAVDFSLRRPREAITALQRVEAGSAHRVKAVVRLLVCHWYLGELEQAGGLLADPSELPRSRLLLYRAFHRFHESKDEASSAAADLAAAAADITADHVLELAGALLTLGGSPLATPVLASLATRPRDIRVVVAELLATHGEVAAAERYAQAITRDFGDDAALFRRLSWWFSRQHHWVDAFRWLQAALRTAPADLTNYLAMAQLWQRRAAFALRGLTGPDGKRADPVVRIIENLTPTFETAQDVMKHE